MSRKKRGEMEEKGETVYIKQRIRKYKEQNIKKKSRFTIRQKLLI